MKCVCPMGGDRVCPGDCPLAVWADLPPTDRKAQRKPIAEKLFHQGFTQEQIATQLGVSQWTISQDLRSLEATSKPPRPKGGRPKSNKLQPERRKNTSTSAEAVACSILDEGKSYAEAEQQTGFSNTVLRSAVAREEGRREPAISRDMLSITAQQKLESAIRQHKHQLDLEFEARVYAEMKQRFEGGWLPEYQQKLDDAQAITAARRGIWPRAIYRKILACLHPDGRRTVSEKMLGEAFHAFNSINEKVLVQPDERPQDPRTKLPATVEGWMERKRQVQEERRAKRAAKQQPAGHQPTEQQLRT